MSSADRNCFHISEKQQSSLKKTSNWCKTSTDKARGLIDMVFDNELRRESLVKARKQYAVKVEDAVIAEIDEQTAICIKQFMELFYNRGEGE